MIKSTEEVDKVSYVKTGVCNDIGLFSMRDTGESAPASGRWVRLEFLSGSHYDLKSDSDVREKEQRVGGLIYLCASRSESICLGMLALNI